VIRSQTGDLAGGVRALRKAVELNPGTQARTACSDGLSNAYELHEEALAVKLKSVSLDPLSMLIVLEWARPTTSRANTKSRFSITAWRSSSTRVLNGAHTGLARSLEALDTFREARVEYEEGRRLSGGLATPSLGLAHLEAAMGNEKEARRILAELTEASLDEGGIGVGYRSAPLESSGTSMTRSAGSTSPLRSRRRG